MKTKKEVLPDFRTCDLNEASAISMYVTVKDVDGSDSHRMFFVFDGKAAEYSRKYWAGEIIGNIRDFANAIKSMKDLLYHHKRSNG